MVVVFLVCAAIGYIVMPSKSSGLLNTTTGITGGSGSGPQQTPKPNPEPALIPEPEPETPVEVNPTPEPKLANVDAVPEIKGVVVGQRDSKRYKMIGMSLSVNAAVASGDPLVYELYEIGGTAAKYTSNNGKFAEVYPIDGGKYLLKVVNKNTGDFADRQVAGFDKIKKYSSADLQAQLNADTQERLFYFHFDTENLKFDCEGIDLSDAPTSLSALTSSRSATGWVYVVIGTPKYDQYNRITYFKVRAQE